MRFWWAHALNEDILIVSLMTGPLLFPDQVLDEKAYYPERKTSLGALLIRSAKLMMTQFAGFALNSQAYAKFSFAQISSVRRILVSSIFKLATSSNLH